jgi:membrane protein DedA with SNARE-associated domain
VVSAPLWVCLGFWLGDDIERAAREGSRFGQYILAGVVLVVAVLIGRAWLRRRRARRAVPPQDSPPPTGR